MKDFDYCLACQQSPARCICSAVDEFFVENRHLMDYLAVMERKEKRMVDHQNFRGPLRCLTCFDYTCTCERAA